MTKNKNKKYLKGSNCSVYCIKSYYRSPLKISITKNYLNKT